MTRMKKYLIAACAVAVVAGVPTAASAVGSSGSASPHAAAKKGSVMVVAPGEKISIGGGVTMWLTKDGKHCVQPAPGSRASCNTVAGGKPGVQSTFGTWDSRHRARIGGFFVAKDAPSRVKVHTLNGVTEGTVVKLAGNPGWGAWYADAGISDASQFDPRNNRTFLRGLTVHGTGGKVIAKFEEPKPVLPRTEGTYREVTGTIVNR